MSALSIGIIATLQENFRFFCYNTVMLYQYFNFIGVIVVDKKCWENASKIFQNFCFFLEKGPRFLFSPLFFLLRSLVIWLTFSSSKLSTSSMGGSFPLKLSISAKAISSEENWVNSSLANFSSREPFFDS